MTEKRLVSLQKASAMGTFHTIIYGDSRKIIELIDQSVHLGVTSHPYWQLKNYGLNSRFELNDSSKISTFLR